MGHTATDTRPRLVKLVRDKVGAFIGGNQSVSYERINDEEEYVRQLRRKLIEEAVEYLDAPCIGELADVLEVVQALSCADLQVPWAQVEEEAKAKRKERGGFLGAVGMYVRTNAPTRHERP